MIFTTKLEIINNTEPYGKINTHLMKSFLPLPNHLHRLSANFRQSVKAPIIAFLVTLSFDLNRLTSLKRRFMLTKILILLHRLNFRLLGIFYLEKALVGGAVGLLAPEVVGRELVVLHRLL